MGAQCAYSKHILPFANGDDFVRLTRAYVPYSRAGRKAGVGWTTNARMPGGMDRDPERPIPAGH